MSDDYTVLNPGVGGDVMDESGVTYVGSPTLRKRARVVIAGEGIDEITSAIDADPTGTEVGLVTRNIPSGTQDVEIKDARVKKTYDLSTETTGTYYSYIGSAILGSVEGNPVWTIRRITYLDGAIVTSEWSDIGVAWDDRVTENYS